MFILLVGPKGSGKSHIGRIIERRLGVHFFHVEPLWMAYHAQCKSLGREPTVAEGIRTIHPKIAEALRSHPHVCVETIGASSELLTDLLSLAPPEATLMIRVSAPLDLCLHRIATRDQTHQIPMGLEAIRKTYELSAALRLNAALVFENEALSEEEIVSAVEGAMAAQGHASSGSPPLA